MLFILIKVTFFLQTASHSAINHYELKINEVIYCKQIFNFAVYFQEQHEVLEGMFKRMSTLFSDMAKYYAFDPKKYTLDEFMGDIKKFIEQFKVSEKSSQTQEVLSTMFRLTELTCNLYTSDTNHIHIGHMIRAS